MPYVPVRGDIIVIALDPPKNKEFAGRHHTICLSADNDSSRVALFCPLTSFKPAKPNPPDDYAVLIPADFTGKPCWALPRHIKSLDWAARGAKKRMGRLNHAFTDIILASLRDWTQMEASPYGKKR